MLEYALGISFLLFCGQERPPPNTSANEVMEKVIQKLKMNDRLKAERTQYVKTIRQDSIDNDWQFVRTDEVKKVLVFGQNGQAVEKLIEKNGKPVNGKPVPHLTNPGQIDLTDFVDYLDKYDYVFADKPDLVFPDENGKYTITTTTRAIDFAPRSNLKQNGLFDGVINGISGTLYVDEQYNLWMLTAALPEDDSAISVRIIPFVGANIKRFGIEWRFQSFHGIMVSQYMKIEVKLEPKIIFSFWDKNKRVTWTYSNYEFISPE